MQFCRHKDGAPYGGNAARNIWSQKELEQRRKGDAAKVRVAKRLRRETTMTLAWIAERLRMGRAAHVANLLYWRDRDAKN